MAMSKPYPKNYKIVLSSTQQNNNNVRYNAGEYEFMINMPLFDNREGRWVFDVEMLSIYSADILKALNVAQSPNTKPFPNNVVAYYDFANSADLGRDVSGNNNHGYPVNLTYSTDRGNSVQFTQTIGSPFESPQRLDLTSNVNFFKRMGNNISVSGWFKNSTTTTLVGTLFGFSDDRNPSDDWLIYIQSNTMTFQCRTNGTLRFRISQTTINDGNWHHFVASSGSAGNYLYLDGVLQTAYTAGNASVTTSFNDVNYNKINIGANKDDKSAYEFAFNGFIADVMIFNEQISPSMITLLDNDDYGYDVYALMGQSNMVGRANVVAGTDDDYSLLSRVFQFPYDVNGNSSGVVSGTTISQATNPLDHISSVAGGSGGENAGQTGLWKTCFEIVAANTRPIRRRILLVPAAKGGTSFNANNWNRGNPINTAAKNAVNAAVALHPWNTLKAILWNQGESDADAQNANYLNQLNAMYDGFKLDIPSFNDYVPFIVGGISGSTSGATWVNNINANLRTFANSKLNAVYVSPGGLTLLDTFHYDATSLRIYGLRYANLLLNAIGDLGNIDFSSFANLHVNQLPQISSYSSKTKGNNDIVITFDNSYYVKDVENRTIATDLAPCIHLINTPLTLYFSNAKGDKINVPNGEFEVVLKIWRVD